MYNENKKKTNFKIVTKDDINEVKDIMEYCRGLVIKNQDEADKYETIQSMRKRTLYISAIDKLNDTNEESRKQIISDYKETNEYYIFLYENYGISYYDASKTKNMRIIKSTDPILSYEDEKLFLQCYNEALSYYEKVLYTKAFDNQPYKTQFFQLMITNIAIQRYLTYKMDNYFNIDTYTDKQLKNSFISYGFDYFDILPTNYKRRLLKILNELVMSKGTNDDIIKILDIFNFDDVDIYSYILGKLYRLDENGDNNYDDPYLVFYRTKAADIVDYDRDMILSYESVTGNDPFWKVEKEDILHHRRLNKETLEFENIDDRHFNTIISKYMSIDFSSNVVQKAKKLSFFMSLLYKFEKDYKDKKGEDFSFSNRDISDSPIDLFTAVTALISLTLKQWNITDEINLYPDLNVNIYGYGNLEDNSDIQSFLDELLILFNQNKRELEYSKSFQQLYKMIQQLNLKGFNEPICSLTAESIYQEFENSYEAQIQLTKGIKKYSDDEGFNLFVSNSENDLFDRLNFIRYFIIHGKYSSYDLFIHNDLTLVFQKYLLLENARNPKKRLEMNYAFQENRKLVEEIELVVDLINTTDIRNAYTEENFFKVYELAKDYNTKRRSKLISDYHLDTEEKLQAYIRTDSSDIAYYKEFNSFFTIFYEPYINLNTKRKFNITDFVSIYKMNETIRESLESEISNRDYNIYKVYRDYLSIWDKKFLNKYDTSIYKNCKHFSDYVKKKNQGLYDYITPDKFTDFKTSKERYLWYQERVFELSENIDAYIGNGSMFQDFPLSGISDYIIKILYLVITVFKSYTIDLLDSNTVWKIDDTPFNSIRLFDETGSEQETDSLVSKISIVDVMRDFEHNIERDSMELKDSISVSTYEDDSKEDKEIDLIN